MAAGEPAPPDASSGPASGKVKATIKQGQPDTPAVAPVTPGLPAPDGVPSGAEATPPDPAMVQPLAHAPSGARRLPRGIEGTFPAAVAVGRDGAWTCSGVIVAPRWVLTAAHCLPATRVAAGLDVLSADWLLDVESSLRHPDERTDLALLRLTAEVTTLPVARRDAAAAPPPRWVELVGFGATDVDGKTGYGTRRKTRIAVQGWGCDIARREQFGCDPDREMVVVSAHGEDTCDGDSGGPVFEWTARGWRLVAITSRPVASARRRCGDGGVYVRVDRVAKWIAEVCNEPDDRSAGGTRRGG